MNAITAINPASSPAESSIACAQSQGTDLDRQLDQIGRTRAFRAKQPVFWEDDPKNSIYEVLEGVVATSKFLADGRRQVTGFHYPGDILGLGSDDRYLSTAQTVTKATLRQLPWAKLEDSMVVFPSLRQRILGSMTGELAKAQDQMVLLGCKSAAEKIASFLLLILENNRRKGSQSNSIGLPMTRSDIADYLGLTTETVCRTITELKAEGVLENITGRPIVVRDWDRLQDLAECAGDE